MMIRVAILCGLFLLMAGCASSPEPASPAQPDVHDDPLVGLRGAAAVSVTLRDFSLPAGAKIGLMDPVLEPGAQHIADNRTPGLIKQSLSDALEQRGYQIASDSDNVSMWIGWYLAMEGDVSDQELLQRFGVVPGFTQQAPGAGFEKGTLIVQALDAGRRNVMWRSAMQGLADLQADGRHQQIRLEYIVQRVMARFPAAGSQ